MDEREAPVTADLLFRQAGPADLEATYEVFVAAANDLRARSGRPPIDDTPQRRAWAIPFRRHALAHDAERFWVAEAKGRVAGFGIATLRERLWYLAALHVLPSFQGRGVGRELLQRCLAAVDGPGAVRIVISESAQPISNAMYAKHGMYQWVPLLHVKGAMPAQLDEPQLGSESIADDKALLTLDAIDRVVLGVARAIDHRYWLSQPGLTGLLFRRRGEAIGYAYVSASGQVGPVAVRFPRELPHVLSASLRSAAERGATHASLVVPGHCRTAIAYLLRNGFRYGESINLLLASRPFGHMDRYLVSAVDALF
ncbi:MAG: GNAT family N-acetyltransferase [Chloroflexi bacterium]|nr:GNAT family N-acetyltransferase [Chloroflexota bacterium]